MNKQSSGKVSLFASDPVVFCDDEKVGETTIEEIETLLVGFEPSVPTVVWEAVRRVISKNLKTKDKRIGERVNLLIEHWNRYGGNKKEKIAKYDMFRFQNIDKFMERLEKFNHRYTFPYMREKEASLIRSYTGTLVVNQLKNEKREWKAKFGIIPVPEEKKEPKPVEFEPPRIMTRLQKRRLDEALNESRKQPKED